jgi:D-alanyl-D-alanine carboxypeptidase
MFMPKARGVSYRKRRKNKGAVLMTAVLSGAAVLLAFAAIVIFFTAMDGKSQTVSQASSTIVPNGQQTELNDWKLILVNDRNSVPDGYKPDIANCRNIPVDSRIVKSLDEMITAASKDGVTLWISSGYRSAETQKTLYNNEVAENKKNGLSQKQAEDTAATVVARPGYSEHNLGLAVDFNGVKDDWYNTPAYKWMQQHAADYGFVLRYPEAKRKLPTLFTSRGITAM